MVKVLQYQPPRQSPPVSPHPIHAHLTSSHVQSDRMCFCFQAHTDIRRLEFLPYHFLLASVGDMGVLRFQVRPLLTHIAFATSTAPCLFVYTVIVSSVQSVIVSSLFVCNVVSCVRSVIVSL